MEATGASSRLALSAPFLLRGVSPGWATFGPLGPTVSSSSRKGPPACERSWEEGGRQGTKMKQTHYVAATQLRRL